MMAARPSFDGNRCFDAYAGVGRSTEEHDDDQEGEIIEAIHEGVFEAHKKYEEWSGGEWIGDYGVEGFLVSEIASTIRQFQEDGEYLFLELPFEHIKEWSGARKRGRPFKGVRMPRRVDIALCNKKKEPTYIVEVKRMWNTKNCIEDLHKIRDLLASFGQRTGGSLKGGFLAVYTQEKESWHILEEEMEYKEEYIQDLEFDEMEIIPHKKKLWEKERLRDGEVKLWEYGCHIIEVSRKQ